MTTTTTITHWIRIAIVIIIIIIICVVVGRIGKRWWWHTVIVCVCVGIGGVWILFQGYQVRCGFIEVSTILTGYDSCIHGSCGRTRQ